MTHFGLENDVSGLTRMDAPLARVPLMRWQRKMTDSFNGSKSELGNCSLNQSASTSSKTPMKILNGSLHTNAKTGGGTSKTPMRKTPHKGSKTPSMLKV